MLRGHNDQDKFEYVKITGKLQNEQTNCLLFDMNCNDLNQLPNQVLSTITQSKNFDYDEKLGWNWHKSKNLPEITYQLNMDVLPKSWKQGELSVEIFVTKKDHEPSTFISLGLMGNTELVLVSQSVTFSGLKFKTTSYKNCHSKFQLLLLLLHNSDGQQQILDSKISPELYVDSRNKINSNLSEKIELLIDPFLPGMIDKKVYKQESRKKNSNFIAIENSLEGLVNYYTAQNIKFKIKHPLFIFLKFSQCVRLFLNSMDNQFDSITLWIQNELKNKEVPNQKVILLIDTECEDPQLKKKAIQICQLLENSYYQIYTNQENVPKDLYEITSTSQLKMDYQLNYKLLQNSVLQESKCYKLVKCSTKINTIIQNNSSSYQDQQSTKLDNLNGTESEQNHNQNIISHDTYSQQLNHINNVMMNHINQFQQRKQEELYKQYIYNNWNIYNNFYPNQNNIGYKY